MSVVRVLITGGAGLIGSVLAERLGGRFDLRSLDRRPAVGIPSTVADIADLDAILPAFDGVDAVVHLAADPSPRAPWESVRAGNLTGTHNVFEAARRAGVPRVVFASSNHVMGAHYFEDPWRQVIAGSARSLPVGYPLLTEEMPVRPDSLYGLSKAFGEHLGRLYHDRYGVSSIHLRIGWVMRRDDPREHGYGAFGLSLWLSQRDCAQLVGRALDAPDAVGFAIVNATSDNHFKIFALDRARSLLGYEPDDGAPAHWADWNRTSELPIA